MSSQSLGGLAHMSWSHQPHPLCRQAVNQCFLPWAEPCAWHWEGVWPQTYKIRIQFPPSYLTPALWDMFFRSREWRAIPFGLYNQIQRCTLGSELKPDAHPFLPHESRVTGGFGHLQKTWVPVDPWDGKRVTEATIARVQGWVEVQAPAASDIPPPIKEQCCVLSGDTREIYEDNSNGDLYWTNQQGSKDLVPSP